MLGPELKRPYQALIGTPNGRHAYTHIWAYSEAEALDLAKRLNLGRVECIGPAWWEESEGSELPVSAGPDGTNM